MRLCLFCCCGRSTSKELEDVPVDAEDIKVEEAPSADNEADNEANSDEFSGFTSFAAAQAAADTSEGFAISGICNFHIAGEGI